MKKVFVFIKSEHHVLNIMEELIKMDTIFKWDGEKISMPIGPGGHVDILQEQIMEQLSHVSEIKYEMWDSKTPKMELGMIFKNMASLRNALTLLGQFEMDGEMNHEINEVETSLNTFESYLHDYYN